MVVVPAVGDFYKITKLPFSLINWIKYDVPTDFRYYEKEEGASGHWCIHEKYLINVIELAYKKLGHVDYSSLPPYIQMEIARQKEKWVVVGEQRMETKVSVNFLDAYTTLYLLPSAPDSVVDSVWRSLAKSSHPDRGGDSEQFLKYSEAYDKIKAQRRDK